jgi:uncharacterized protein
MIMENILAYNNIDRNTYLIKNLKNNGIVEIDKQSYKILIKDPPDSVRKKKLILDMNNSADFFTSMKLERLSLIILTSTACNLNCSYCFENHISAHNQLNTKEDIDKIIKFIGRSLVGKKYKTISISFTGGEPFINYKFLYHCIDSVNRKYSDNYKCEYSIITNGTLINRTMYSFLDKNNVSLQISLDGDKEYHDFERCDVRKKGSFDIIMKNLQDFMNRTSKTQIKIRINVSAQNVKSIVHLIDKLPAIVSNYGERIMIYFDSIVVPTTNALYVSNNDKLRLLSIFYTQAFINNLNIIKDYYNAGNCMMKNDHSITINANGDLYKCFSLIGYDKFITGNIRDTSIRTCDVKTYNNLCADKNCVMRDRCYGGCPYNSYIYHKKIDKDCQKYILCNMNKLLYTFDIFEIENIQKDTHKVGEVQSNVSINQISI